MAGIDLSEDKKAPVAATAPAAPYAVTSTVTPAQDATNKTFAKADAEWDKQGARLDAAGLPHPLGCVKPAPAISVSQLYDVPNRGSAQITVTTYPAGVGGAAFDRLVRKSAECKNANVALSVLPQETVGTEASRFQSSWSGNNITTVMWRRGDVVAFVATQSKNAANATSIAASVDSALSANLGACVDQQSKSSDSTRNVLFARDNFRGNRSTRDVATRQASPPTLTAEQTAAGVKPVEVPSRSFSVPDVFRPVKPTAYPVYPALPKELDVPEPPAEPKPQTLKDVVDIRVPDPDGPGCGWAFAATAAAGYDAASIEARNDRREAEAQATLDADATRWVADVQAYWSSYAAYRQDVRDFRAYAKAVSETADAWSDIAQQWADYYDEYDKWETFEQYREDLIEAKAQAKIDFSDANTACDVLATSANPDDVAEYADTCPPERPEVLGVKVPKSQDAPSKPEDPRP
jgi:hypothetical protein